MKYHVYFITFLLLINIVYSAEYIIVKDSWIGLNGTDSDGKIFTNGDINFSITNVNSNADVICFDWVGDSPSNYSNCYYDIDGCQDVEYFNETEVSYDEGVDCGVSACVNMLDKDFTTFTDLDGSGNLIYINWTINYAGTNSYQLVTYKTTSSVFVDYIYCWDYDLLEWDNFLTFDSGDTQAFKHNFLPDDCVSQSPLRVLYNLTGDAVPNGFNYGEVWIKDTNEDSFCSEFNSCNSFSVYNNMGSIHKASANVENFYEGVDVPNRVCDGCEHDTSDVQIHTTGASILYDCDNSGSTRNQTTLSSPNTFEWFIGQSHAYDCGDNEGTWGEQDYSYVLNYTIAGLTKNITTPTGYCNTDSEFNSSYVCSEYFDDLHDTNKDASINKPCKFEDNFTCLLDSSCASNYCNVTVFTRYVCEPDKNESGYDIYDTGALGFTCTYAQYNENDFTLDTDNVSCGSGNYCDGTADNVTSSGTPNNPCRTDKSEGSVCSYYSYQYDPECVGNRVCDNSECNTLTHTSNIVSSDVDDDDDNNFVVRIGEKIGLNPSNSMSTALKGYDTSDINFNISCACWDYNNDGVWDEVIGAFDLGGYLIQCPSLSFLQGASVCPGVSSVTQDIWNSPRNRTENLGTSYTVALKVMDGYDANDGVHVSSAFTVDLSWVNGTTINLTNEGQSDGDDDYNVLEDFIPTSYISFSSNDSTCEGCKIDYTCYWITLLNSTTSNVTYNKCYQRTGASANSSFCDNIGLFIKGCDTYETVTNPKDQIVNLTFNDSLALKGNNHLTATSPFSIGLRIINSDNESFQLIKDNVQFVGVCDDSYWDYNEDSADYGGDCGTCIDNSLSGSLNETEIDYGGRCGYCIKDTKKKDDYLFDLIDVVKDLVPDDYHDVIDDNFVSIIPITPKSSYCESSEEKIGIVGIMFVVTMILASALILILFGGIIAFLFIIGTQLFAIGVTVVRVIRRVNKNRKIIKKYIKMKK